MEEEHKDLRLNSGSKVKSASKLREDANTLNQYSDKSEKDGGEVVTKS
jgi:hypothetical protein